MCASGGHGAPGATKGPARSEDIDLWIRPADPLGRRRRPSRLKDGNPGAGTPAAPPGMPTAACPHRRELLRRRQGRRLHPHRAVRGHKGERASADEMHGSGRRRIIDAGRLHPEGQGATAFKRSPIPASLPLAKQDPTRSRSRPVRHGASSSGSNAPQNLRTRALPCTNPSASSAPGYGASRYAPTHSSPRPRPPGSSPSTPATTSPSPSKASPTAPAPDTGTACSTPQPSRPAHAHRLPQPKTRTLPSGGRREGTGDLPRQNAVHAGRPGRRRNMGQPRHSSQPIPRVGGQPREPARSEDLPCQGNRRRSSANDPNTDEGTGRTNRCTHAIPNL